jgi:hypothetical protein
MLGLTVPDKLLIKHARRAGAGVLGRARRECRAKSRRSVQVGEMPAVGRGLVEPGRAQPRHRTGKARDVERVEREREPPRRVRGRACRARRSAARAAVCLRARWQPQVTRRRARNTLLGSVISRLATQAHANREAAPPSKSPCSQTALAITSEVVSEHENPTKTIMRGDHRVLPPTDIGFG